MPESFDSVTPPTPASRGARSAKSSSAPTGNSFEKTRPNAASVPGAAWPSTNSAETAPSRSMYAPAGPELANARKRTSPFCVMPGRVPRNAIWLRSDEGSSSGTTISGFAPPRPR